MTTQPTTEIRVELHSTTSREDVQLCSAMALPAEAGNVPEWVHLVPAGQQVGSYDGRRWTMLNSEAVVAASKALIAQRPAPVDEYHSTDLKGPKGEPAPARGWLEDFEVRADGIWGKVAWNPSGRALLEDRAYRGISPAIAVDKDGNVQAILRASLSNTPNLKGLTALNSESQMDLIKLLAQRLGLDASASQDTIVAAVDGLIATRTELNSQIGKIAMAVGKDGGTVDVIIGAVTALKDASPAKTVDALQVELNSAIARINELEGGSKRQAAEAVVDKAISERAAGASARREEFIQLHMENPARANAILAGLPRLNSTGTSVAPPAPKDGEVSLNSEEAKVAQLMGIPVDKMAATAKSLQSA